MYLPKPIKLPISSILIKDRNRVLLDILVEINYNIISPPYLIIQKKKVDCTKHKQK